MVPPFLAIDPAWRLVCPQRQSRDRRPATLQLGGSLAVPVRRQGATFPTVSVAGITTICILGFLFLWWSGPLVCYLVYGLQQALLGLALDWVFFPEQ